MSDQELSEGSMKEIPAALATERTGYGEGFSEGEALLNWLQTDTDLMTNGQSWGMDAFEKDKPVHVNQVRKAVLAKRVTREKAPKTEVSGWQTVFVIRDPHGAEMGMEAKKGPAVKLAKEIALRELVACTIHKEKRPKSGSTLEMTVTPASSKPGRFKFKASFKY